MQTKTLLLLLASTPLFLATQAQADTAPLTAETLVEVSPEAKRFDLVQVDGTMHRLLAAHSQAGTLMVIDLATNKLVREIPADEKVSGVAIDAADGKYFAGGIHGVAVIDSKTLEKTGFINTTGPTDDIAFDSVDGKLYVTHDDGTELWVVDAKKDAITGHIDIPGVPEIMGLDAADHRLYLNIKDKNEVAVLDLAKGTVLTTWPTPATDSPHGLVLDTHAGRLYVAGHSANISVLALPDGKSLPSINIGDGRVDQIAFDASSNRLYVPSSGRLVAVDTAKDAVLGEVAIPKGTHSVAVDPSTHLVWIVYADDKASYAQAFAPPR